MGPQSSHDRVVIGDVAKKLQPPTLTWSQVSVLDLLTGARRMTSLPDSGGIAQVAIWTSNSAVDERKVVRDTPADVCGESVL